MPPVKKSPSGQNTRTKKSTFSPGCIIILVIAVCVTAGAVYFYGYPWFQEYRASRHVLPPVEIAVQDTTYTPPPVVVQQETVPSVPKGYYIIVGSFRSKEYAEQMAKTLSGSLKLEVFHFEEIGVYRVSAGLYDNIHNAYNNVNRVWDVDGCENAWVLENR
jgi:hypothetical protein